MVRRGDQPGHQPRRRTGRDLPCWPASPATLCMIFVNRLGSSSSTRIRSAWPATTRGNRMRSAARGVSSNGTVMWSTTLLFFCGQASYVALGSLLPAIQGRGSVQTPHKTKVSGSVEAPSISLPDRVFPRTPDASTSQFTVIGASSSGSTSGGLCRASVSETERSELQGRRSYVALERGKQLKSKEPDVRRRITRLATEEQKTGVSLGIVPVQDRAEPH